MAEATPPPPSGPSGSVTGQTSVMFRNIIVGVTTTILGSTAVYFLGFHNKKGGETKGSYAEVKEATTKAWKSYVTIDNIYYKNVLSISKDQSLAGNPEKLKNEFLREAARFRKDVENVMKDRDIDPSFINMIERRFDREKESEDVINSFFNKLQEILNSNETPEKKQEQMISETRLYQDKVNGMMERSVNEIEDLSKTLSERYGQPFDLNEVMAYRDYKKGVFSNNKTNGPTGQGNPSDSIQIDGTMFPGKWSTMGANISLNADGNFFWDVLSTGDKSSGSWKFVNNQLYMYPKSPGNGNPTTWVFNLSVTNSNLFTMTLNTQPYNTYQLARIRE